jgi:putative flavoprotein involved in K+ transport
LPAHERAAKESTMSEPARLLEPAHFALSSESLVEPGEALHRIAAPESRSPASARRLDVVVVGAGQAGLSTGYHLAKRGLNFVILDANERVGNPWRQRWDSLRLFTPARFNGLHGMPFPAPRDSFPTKDEMGDYLEAYAKAFQLPVKCATRVERITRDGEGFRVRAGGVDFLARSVVIAMSSYQRARVPDFAAELSRDVVQVHSLDYRNPSQLKPGGVLIAGAGNSGSEIAMELAKNHRVWMAGRDTGHVPFRVDGFWGKWLMTRLVLRFVFHYLLTIKSPLGRRVRAKIVHQGGPLIRVKPIDLERAGVTRVGRVRAVDDGMPVLDDGTRLNVANVVWCTGFRPSYSWIELPGFGEDGEPMHEGGVVTAAPGLYFVGLHFLYSMSSTMIHGVGRDARRIANAIADRLSRQQPSV